MPSKKRRHSPMLHRRGETRSAVPIVVAATVVTAVVVLAVGLLLWPSSDVGTIAQRDPDQSLPSTSNPQAALAESQVNTDDGGNPPLTTPQATESQSKAPKPKVVPNRRLSVPASAAPKSPADLAEQVDPAITLAALRKPGVAFAYDPTTKRLAVAERESGELSFYEWGETLTHVAAVEGSSKPLALATKRYKDRSYFVSGGDGEGALQVFDAATTERLATIAINAKKVNRISASLSAKDPYVYYSAAKTDERHPEWYLGRIHIKTLKDEGLVAKEYNDFALSPDGSILYARRTVSSPTGFDAWRIVNLPASSLLTYEQDELHARVQLEPLFDDHTTNPAYVPDPQGLLVAAGGEIYSPTLNTQYGRCDFPIDCFLPNSPWAVGIDDDQLKATSLNQMSYDKSIHNMDYDMKSVGAVRLPKGFDLVPMNSKPTRGYPHNKESRRAMALERRRPAPVYYDAEVDRFLIASAERVAIVPLSALKLPDEPRLAVQLSDAPQLDTITPGTIEIDTGDPRVKTKLLSVRLSHSRRECDQVFQWFE